MRFWKATVKVTVCDSQKNAYGMSKSTEKFIDSYLQLYDSASWVPDSNEVDSLSKGGRSLSRSGSSKTELPPINVPRLHASKQALRRARNGDNLGLCLQSPTLK